MDFESMELTIEDILNMHRQWITKLVEEDRKTDTEIIALLYGRGFLITLSQLRRCIVEWGIARQSFSAAPAIIPDVQFDEDWEWIPSRNPPTTPSQHSFTPSDPEMVDHYSRRELPSIPPPDTRSSNKDRLKIICHHGPSPSQAHETETTLSDVPNGPTPLETYTEDEQAHEILALGLTRDPIPITSYRRAGQAVGDNPRQRRHPKLRKRDEIVLRKKK